MTNGKQTGRNGQSKQRETDSGAVDVQTLLQMGEHAARLLQNQTYLLAHQGSINDLINQLVASDPHEVKLRESLYHQIRAHGAVANQLAGMVGRAQEILRQQEGRQHDDALERQGFGLNDDWNPQTPVPEQFG